MPRIRTEEELAESFWWWRYCRFADAPDPANKEPGWKPNHAEWRDWKGGMEQLAQEWEHIRRFRPELDWPPFYEMGGYVARNLRVRLIGPRERWARKITTEVSPPGWSDPDPEGWRYNLNCTKDALRRDYSARFLATENEVSKVLSGSLRAEDLVARLVERRKQLPTIAEHLRWVEAQARAKGVEMPRGLRGQRNRSISWSWVEVLDIACYVAVRRNPLRKLSLNERTMKTLATNAAKKLLPKYVAALAETRTMPGFRELHTPAHIAHHRKVILGNWAPRTNS
jgi:hypothetical protein